jgi:hypothetical protein
MSVLTPWLLQRGIFAGQNTFDLAEGWADLRSANSPHALPIE